MSCAPSAAPALGARGLLVDAQVGAGGVGLDAVTLVVEIIDVVDDVAVDLACALDEGTLDRLARLGRGLDARLEPVALGPGAGLLEGDGPLPAPASRSVTAPVTAAAAVIGEIALVANEDDGDVGVGGGTQLVEPVLHVLKRLAAGDVVDEEGAGGAAEVRPGDGAKRLLAGRVPDL